MLSWHTGPRHIQNCAAAHNQCLGCDSCSCQYTPAAHVLWCFQAARKAENGGWKWFQQCQWILHAGRWEARIGIPSSKHIYLGLHCDEDTAARAYDSALVSFYAIVLLCQSSSANDSSARHLRKEILENILILCSCPGKDTGSFHVSWESFLTSFIITKKRGKAQSNMATMVLRHLTFGWWALKDNSYQSIICRSASGVLLLLQTSPCQTIGSSLQTTIASNRSVQVSPRRETSWRIWFWIKPNTLSTNLFGCISSQQQHSSCTRAYFRKHSNTEIKPF